MNKKSIIVKIDKDIEEIIPTFLENRNKDIGLLKKAIKNENLDEIQVIGHKLAGNAGSYGMPDLGNIGSELEKSAKEKKKEQINILIEKYADYLERLNIEYE